jgi:hypothetical protein
MKRMGTQNYGIQSPYFFIFFFLLYLFFFSCGHSYLTSDVSCPLRYIGGIANSENLWRNMQLKLFPWDMDFNLMNSSVWESFFTSSNLMPLELKESIQVFLFFCIYL